jgi:hypothetical protein
MSTQSLESVIGAIFLAPGEAALKAESGYRKIWADWLNNTATLVDKDIDKLIALMPLAPVFKISGAIDIAISMRVASISQTDAKLSVGAGPISVTGGYFRQTSEESAMNVRAAFTLTNTEMDIKTFLEKTGQIPIAESPESLNKAIEFLKKP